ncbi:MAG: alpha/beta hydrolase [Alistipes sp.]|nr:alpha/beta hydrolase [Alistipes sp.]
MRKILLTILFAATANLLAAQQPLIVDLWPEGAPGENGLTEVRNPDGTYSQVTDPELEVYLPKAGDANGQAVVICPGGSYSGLAFIHEGRDVARWLNKYGIAGIVLKYRMPGGNRMIPGDDVRKAIETVREKSAEWNIDPSQVGVIGFSAGGHLASTAVTHYTSPANRPDFGILVYPVISMSDELAHKGSRKNLTGADLYSDDIAAFSNETRVTADTPPVLILFSDDDGGVDPRNGTAFYEATKQHGVPAEIHIWPSGGHGWGWRDTFRYSDEMKSIVARWLDERR